VFSRAESVLENILCFYTVLFCVDQTHFLISADRGNLPLSGPVAAFNGERNESKISMMAAGSNILGKKKGCLQAALLLSK
jgi:hypothetical protein